VGGALEVSDALGSEQACDVVVHQIPFFGWWIAGFAIRSPCRIRRPGYRSATNR
jgi:hypothetical protein